jgi:hypothetical protein
MMFNNNAIALKIFDELALMPEKTQAEVDALHAALARRYGPGFAGYIIDKYTSFKPAQMAA